MSVFALGALMAACETAPTDNGQVNVASAPVPGSAEDFKANIKDRVFFGFDKHNLSPEAKKTLDAQAGWLKTYPNVKATIEGHADVRGTREYNLALGEKRANSVKKQLATDGVSKDRLDVVSYGKDKPFDGGTDEAAHAANRVVLTTVK
ncbi:MAG TPA: peptidoglycan-associated lipoprotein Pal [Alphaproteobacteria bacterium]|nr:peptidoglycan-associated lipoprotein Pal [Alphaproteobacteria bacterium]